MSLPNYLAQIKSSGIYRFVWDKSEVAGVDAEILRLVVGYSDKGPFNTPVYIKSVSEFVKVFGDGSKKLEKRGIFFHRLAKQALAAGPIIALNLKKFEDEKVSAWSTDVNTSSIETTIEIPVEEIYDTTRFWKLDPATLKSGYIEISNTDSAESSATVFIRGAKATGYDVTLVDWYNNLGEEMPEYMQGYESLLVSDFLAEVYVFKGEFTPSLVSTEPLKQYFNVDTTGEVKVTLKPYITNVFGEKVDTLKALANETASGIINSYVGVTLPYFKAQNGAYMSLDLLFNNDQPTHKLMMNINGDKLEDGTMELNEVMTIGFNTDTHILGVEKDAYVSDGVYDNDTDEWIFTASNANTFGDPRMITYELGNTSKTIDKDAAKKLFDSIKVTSSKPIAFSGATKYAGDDSFCKILIPEGATITDINVSNASEDIKYYVENDITTVKPTTAGTYGVIFTPSAKGVLEVTIKYKESGHTDDTTKNASTTVLDAISENIDSLNPVKWSKVSFVAGDRFYNNSKILTCTDYKLKDDGSYELSLVDLEGEAVTSVSDKLQKINGSQGYTCNGMKPIYLEGYEYGIKCADLTMKSKVEYQDKIMSALTEYQGMRTALTSRVDIDYRYIVDTFEAFITEEVHAPLAALCKEKDNALALLNFPSVKSFKECDYTSFTDENNRFQTKYIAEGGNPRKSNAVKFSLVSEPNGASFTSYNTPLAFAESGNAAVKINVPSAALVSNNFMQKYLSRQPYYVVAGQNYGRVTYTNLVGPDFNYGRADLDVLEPMGVNAMVYVPRVGTYINSNQTAKQNPVTALSKINVRELVIYLQDEIEKLLKSYQWEMNTQELRNTIKEKADAICERVRANGGIYAFLNVCDESNNTADVIDNEMIVLSTSIEPGKACGKMVQELTLYRTGGLSSVIK